MSTHSKAAAKFIADAERTAWHDKALYAVREKRDKMARTVPEWEDLRRMSSEIKRHTLSHLGHYLEEFERNATANGMVVHWAADADEMNATVWRLVQEHGGRNLIKSKSMLSEECGLTPYLLPARAGRRCRRERPGRADHAVAGAAAQPHRAARHRRTP